MKNKINTIREWHQEHQLQIGVAEVVVGVTMIVVGVKLRNKLNQEGEA